jgi:hypothetical protein
VFDEATRAFLESGCALIVGTVGPDGAPHAGRAWGLTLVDLGPPARGRLLLDTDDERMLANVASGTAIAVTATSVTTLRSMQLKGRALGPEVASADDDAAATRYFERFFDDVHETDGVAWEVFRTMIPSGYVACLVEVDEVYDQTPGPGAGARLEDQGGR